MRKLAACGSSSLGGTRFVGRHIVEAARAAGHAVTVFNRGPHARCRGMTSSSSRGDREHAATCESLRGRDWDACLDVNGYLPQHVRASAELLAERVARYAFISTASVYVIPGPPPIDETGALHAVPADEVDAVEPELYGPLKVACEQEVERAFPGRALILRPGIVAGPYDPTNRFTWWVERVARGGEVLAPGLAGLARAARRRARPRARSRAALIGAAGDGRSSTSAARRRRSAS